MLHLGQEGYLPAGATRCTQVREQPLLIVPLTLDRSFKLGSNLCLFGELGKAAPKIPGVLLLREGGLRTLSLGSGQSGQGLS